MVTFGSTTKCYEKRLQVVAANVSGDTYGEQIRGHVTAKSVGVSTHNCEQSAD